MKISTRTEGDITVADVSGSLDTQTSAPASEELTRIAQGTSKLLLNFEQLEFLSSAGLRILLRTAKQLNGAGGTMKICNPTGTVKEVMEISGFGNFLDLHDSESEALAAF
jgi:anti-anti-sigma factor